MEDTIITSSINLYDAPLTPVLDWKTHVDKESENQQSAATTEDNTNANEKEQSQVPIQVSGAIEDVEPTNELATLEQSFQMNETELSMPLNNGESNENHVENGLKHCSEEVSKDEYIILDENAIILPEDATPESNSETAGLSVEDNVALLLGHSKSSESLATESNETTVETYVLLPAAEDGMLQVAPINEQLQEDGAGDQIRQSQLNAKANEEEDYNYITTSTEEVIKVYDQNVGAKLKVNASKRQTILLNKMLNDADKEPAVMDDNQLLAILEGESGNHVNLKPENKTAVPAAKTRIKKNINMDPEQEKMLALQQLKELPFMRRKSTPKKPKIVDVKIPKVEKAFAANTKKDSEPSHENCDPMKAPTSVKTYSKKVSDDISMLIADWIEEEVKVDAPQGEASEEKEKEDDVKPPVEDTLPENDKSVSKTSESSETETCPRRISRIIKKKVIYDPDNPATFKYAASNITKKDAAPKADPETVQNTTKAVKSKAKKTEADVSVNEEVNLPVEETSPAKRKSGSGPVANSAKKKKKSEVDKLLEDEGAVNMIYQVERGNNNANVPEIALKPNKQSMISLSKERKSLLSKTKIIKKAVINLCKSNENKQSFRARREVKVSKSDQAPVAAASLRNSMQSPSLSELSNADESRIIRRHSSSSFSSGCLSPRPQSPTGESVNNEEKSTTNSLLKNSSLSSTSPAVNPKKSKAAILAAVKRGRGRLSLKPPKEKDVAPIEAAKLNASDYTQLSIDCQNNVTHIVVKPTGNSHELYDLQVLRELRCAIEGAGASGGAVLLTSAEGALCGGLDVRCVLQTTPHQQRINANRLTEAFKELVVSLCSCPCPVVMGVGGACVGPGVALLSLADLALASDRASFCAAPRQRRRIPPEGACLLARPQALPPQLSRELLLCGRKLTASEALQRGLVARTLWPDCFIEELKSITTDLANHPKQSLSVVKNVLRRGDVPSAVTALRHESRLLTELWCTPDGQEAIRETHKHL